MIVPPCKDCLGRTVECHSSCDEYKLYKEVKGTEKKMIRRKKYIESYFYSNNRVGGRKNVRNRR